MYKLEIPSELKSLNSKEALIRSGQLVTMTKSIGIPEHENAFVEIFFDENQKLVDVILYSSPGNTMPLSVDVARDGGSAMTPYSNCEDKPSDMGVILCVVNTIADAIMEWF
jgi:hypothetical protein